MATIAHGYANWKLLEARRVDAGVGRIVCVANQKGGVGKTTTSVNLAAALALKGHKVLVVDVDPQSNATTGVGLDHRVVDKSTYDLLLGSATLDEVAVECSIENLWCAPASLDLAGAEIELVGEMAREHKLGEVLAEAGSEYEVIFLDCPPSLGLLTLNALTAAQDLIVPVQCEYYALEGLGQLLGTAERVRRSLNPNLRIAGFLLTMYDARTKLSGQVAAEVRGHFGPLCYSTVIPRSVRLSEAPSYGEPVLTLDPSSRGSISYRLLAAEVEERYGLGRVPPPPPPPSARQEEIQEKGSAEEIVMGTSLGSSEKTPATVATRGPGGRGYGVVTSVPAGLGKAWPPREPWS